jgi:hypothetical protein
MESNKFLKFELHKSFGNYLGKIEIPDENTTKKEASTHFTINKPKLIIILDVSGSMGYEVPRMVQIIIPEMIKRLNINSSDNITLITFASFNDVNVYTGNATYISNLNLNASGCTYMSCAIDKLYEMIKNNEINNKILRILSISDGELHDQDSTMNSAEKLKQLLQSGNKVVNSQAIRLKTGLSEPDTRGLSSMIQLSTLGKQMLIDIDARDIEDKIIEEMKNLFINDGLGKSLELKTEENILQEEPWLPKINKIYLFPGLNSFWINVNANLPKDEIFKEIEKKVKIYNSEGKEKQFKCLLKEDLSEINYQELIKDKINFYFQQIKVLKIVNTQESIEKMDKIITFFNDLEENLFAKNAESEKFKNSSNLKLFERAQVLKMVIKRRQTSLANKMREIRNDDKINTLNSKQQAEYLRNVSINDKTGKSLAKRALGGGIDFDETVRKEVEQIYKHRHELSNVDESKLTNSFYSTCNTLEGIKAVCKFYEESKKDNIFQETTANDIIKLINIVGIAGYNEIGNFPDPMTYRIKTLYPGTFVSLSDILIAYEVTGGQNLKEIGSQNEINISVPYFENETIQKFLMKYAPKLLEYHSSVSMRRILADVQYTYEYTLLAGLYHLVAIILKDKKEINIEIFVKLTKSYLIAAGNHFAYVLDLLEEQKSMDKDGLSLYIANNGITNMVSPILLYLKSHKGENADSMIKRIIRATYQFEIYQYAKKNIRAQKTDDPEKYVKGILIDLLNIDLNKNRTKVPELFDKIPENPVFYDIYAINDKKFNGIMDKIYWADYITIIPSFLKASLAEDYISEFKNIEINNITEELRRERLGINFDSKLFKLYCIVQSFLQHEQAQRCDVQLKKMKILDLGIQENAEKIVKDFIQQLYREQYESDLKERAIEEKKILIKELVQQIINSPDIETFYSLLKNGITKGIQSYKLLNHSSEGFMQIINLLADQSKDIPLKKFKILVLVTGKDKNKNVIWDASKNIKSLKCYYPLKNVLVKKEWDYLIKTLNNRGLHIYRDQKNRQGHCNDLPSYWALGFNSVYEMKENISEEEFNKYVDAHYNCCGFFNGEYTVMRRCDKKRQNKNNI